MALENLMITGKSLKITERLDKKVISIENFGIINNNNNNNKRKSAKRYFHPQKSRDNQQEIIQKTIANNYIKWKWRNTTKKKWHHFRQLQSDRRQQLIKYGLKHHRVNFFSFLAKTVTRRGCLNFMKTKNNSNKREILKIPSFIYPRFNDNYPWRGRQTLCKKIAIKAATAALTTSTTTGCYTKNNCSAVLQRIHTANTPDDFKKLFFINKKTTTTNRFLINNNYNSFNQEQQVISANSCNKNIENFLKLAINCYNEGIQKQLNYLNNLQKVNENITKLYLNKNIINCGKNKNLLSGGGGGGITKIGITNYNYNNKKLSVMNNSDVNKLANNFLTKLNITKLPEIILTDYSVPKDNNNNNHNNKGVDNNNDNNNQYINDQLQLDVCFKKENTFNKIKDDNQHANNNDNLTNVNKIFINYNTTDNNQQVNEFIENTTEEINLINKKLTLVNAATSVCHITNFKNRCLTIPKEKHFCSESRPP